MKEEEEERSEKNIEKVKNKLLAIAALGGGGALATNVALPASINYTFKKEYEHYPDAVNKKSSPELYKKIVEAHKQLSGLPTPSIYTNGKDGSSYHMEGKGAGYVQLTPHSGAFTLAHELGHRQVHRGGGVLTNLQNIAPNLSKSPLQVPALIGLAATQDTPVKALKNTLALAYLVNTPTIASELMATQKGMQYLSKANLPGSKSLAVSQAVPYLLEPAGQALVSAAVGQAIRFAGQRLRRASRKKDQDAE